MHVLPELRVLGGYVLRRAFKILTALVVVACVHPGMLAAQSPTNEIIAVLDREAAALAGPGYAPVTDPFADDTTPNSEKRYRLPMKAGVPIAIVGACGEGCGRIGLRLIGPTGTVLTSTPDSEPVAIVAGKPDTAGEYQIEVRVPDCRIAVCRFGLQQFAIEPAVPPGDQAAADSLLRFVISSAEHQAARQMAAPIAAMPVHTDRSAAPGRAGAAKSSTRSKTN